MSTTVKLGQRTVGAGHAPYIIAEACINHEGDIEIAGVGHQIPRLCARQCLRVAGERQALGYRFGTNARTQFVKRGGKAHKVLRVGRWGDVSVLGRER